MTVQFTVPAKALAGNYDIRVVAWDSNNPSVALINEVVLGAFSVP